MDIRREIETKARVILAVTAVGLGGLSLAACGAENSEPHAVTTVSVDAEPSTTADPNVVCKDELAQFPEGYASAYITPDGECAVAIPSERP